MANLGALAPQRTERRRTGLAPWRWGINLGVAAALTLLSAPAALAAPAAQEAEPQPILLGELAAATLAAGESASFTFDAPDDALYVIAPGDEAAAANFTLVITSDRGDEVYNDLLQTIELELDDGDYIIEATAAEEGALSFFVTGQLGEFSDDFGNPGEMVNGSFVTAEGVEGTLYAELDIEDLDTWQRAFLYIQGGDGDIYSASVSGESVYESISDSSVEPPLAFWTQGGRYSVEISPVEGGESLTVVSLLSGPTPEIEVGTEVEGTIAAGNTQTAFRFSIPEANRIVRVTVQSDNEEIDAELVVSIDPTTDTWGSYNLGSNEDVNFAAPLAGDYIVRVYASDPLEEPLDFTLLVELGDAAASLEPNSKLWDTVVAGETNVYTLNVDEPNKLLSVILVAGAEQDLDMTAQQVDESGNVAASLSASSFGSIEVMAQTVSEPGIYELRVSGEYASEDTDYVLDVRLESADEIGAQWAVEATASSEFGADGYSAAQATGEPTISVAGDNAAAWASQPADGSTETLELTFENFVTPTGVRIYESYNPGAVTMIEAFDEENEEWVALWEGEEASESDMRVFSPEFEAPEFKTNRIRLTISSDLVASWNEIDAVQLLGLP